MGHDSPSPENPGARFEAAKAHFKEAEEGLKERLSGILAEIKVITDDSAEASDKRSSLSKQAGEAYKGHLDNVVEYLSEGHPERKGSLISGALDAEIDDLVLEIGQLNK